MQSNTALSLPVLGALWPEQGGHFAGVTRDAAGNTFAVIVSPKVVEFKALAWGPYGKDVPGCSHFTDGLANTQALLAAKTEHPAAKACSSIEHEGHADWYLPSAGELQLAHMHCKDLFSTEGYYWSSTQNDRDYAFVQDFEFGYSSYNTKDTQRRVRAVRRFIHLCRPGAGLHRLPTYQAQ